MTKACEHCGADNPALAKFCRQCGQPCAPEALRSTTRVTPVMQQWRRLKHRMTRKEVRAILGEPARIETSAPGAPPAEAWSYEYESCGEAAEHLGGEVAFALPDGIVTGWTEPDWKRLI